MAVNPKRDSIIAELVSDMDFFGLDITRAQAINGKKWQLPKRTFDRYWKTAKDEYAAEQSEISAAVMEVKKEVRIAAEMPRIMDKAERMHILTQMADGTLQVQRNVVTKDGILVTLALPDYNDRKAAIAELNKMDGEYAPLRKDITSNGEQLPPVNFHILLDE